MEVDLSIVSTATLLVLTMIVTVSYYARIRRATHAYEDAKNVVEEVIISFDRQLQRQEASSQAVNQKIEALAVETGTLTDKLRDQEDRLTRTSAEIISKASDASNVNSLRSELERLKQQVEDGVKALEQAKQQVTTPIESQIETAIPIRREHALAPLTETELRVLEFIAEGGERTAPEVKEMIKLTREHTARLMKKLYEEGYLERRPEKIPYAYRVKEEMLRILKKSEAKT